MAGGFVDFFLFVEGFVEFVIEGYCEIFLIVDFLIWSLEKSQLYIVFFGFVCLGFCICDLNKSVLGIGYFGCELGLVI